MKPDPEIAKGLWSESWQDQYRTCSRIIKLGSNFDGNERVFHRLVELFDSMEYYDEGVIVCCEALEACQNWRADDCEYLDSAVASFVGLMLHPSHGEADFVARGFISQLLKHTDPRRVIPLVRQKLAHQRPDWVPLFIDALGTSWYERRFEGVPDALLDEPNTGVARLTMLHLLLDRIQMEGIIDNLLDRWYGGSWERPGSYPADEPAVVKWRNTIERLRSLTADAPVDLIREARRISDSEEYIEPWDSPVWRSSPGATA